jgi:IMP dehydrogenase
VTEIEIGRGKRGRRAYSFDDIAIVPSRRTRDPEEVSVGWQIDAYHFDIPVIAAPMDSVTSPASAIAFGRLGGLPVLDLEGLVGALRGPERRCWRRSPPSTPRSRRPACRRSTAPTSTPTS